MASAVGVWCEEVEEEGAPAVRACRRSRFVAQYRAYPLQSSFSVRVRGLCYGPGFWSVLCSSARSCAWCPVCAGAQGRQARAEPSEQPPGGADLESSRLSGLAVSSGVSRSVRAAQ